jgi:hypothetical protein
MHQKYFHIKYSIFNNTCIILLYFIFNFWVVCYQKFATNKNYNIFYCIICINAHDPENEDLTTWARAVPLRSTIKWKSSETTHYLHWLPVPFIIMYKDWSFGLFWSEGNLNWSIHLFLLLEQYQILWTEFIGPIEM